MKKSEIYCIFALEEPRWIPTRTVQNKAVGLYSYLRPIGEGQRLFLIFILVKLLLVQKKTSSSVA